MEGDNLKNLDNESHAGSMDDAMNMQNVKKKFRPDWMDDENKIFINRLNKICESYEKSFSDVSKLKETVFKSQRIEIEELQHKTRDMDDTVKLTKDKLTSIEESIPQMIRDMVKYYFEQRVEKQFQTLVTLDILKEKLSKKMDTALFIDYKKKQEEREAIDNAVFKIDEKFHQVERKIQSFITRGQMQVELKNMVNLDKFNDLKEQVTRMKYNEETTSKNLQQRIQDVNDELIKKTEDIFERISELQEQVRDIEEDLKPEDDESSSHKSISQSNPGKSINDISQNSQEKLQKQKSFVGISQKSNLQMGEEIKNDQMKESKQRITPLKDVVQKSQSMKKDEQKTEHKKNEEIKSSKLNDTKNNSLKGHTAVQQSQMSKYRLEKIGSDKVNIQSQGPSTINVNQRQQTTLNSEIKVQIVEQSVFKNNNMQKISVEHLNQSSKIDDSIIKQSLQDSPGININTQQKIQLSKNTRQESTEFNKTEQLKSETIFQNSQESPQLLKSNQQKTEQARNESSQKKKIEFSVNITKNQISDKKAVETPQSFKPSSQLQNHETSINDKRIQDNQKQNLEIKNEFVKVNTNIQQDEESHQRTIEALKQQNLMLEKTLGLKKEPEVVAEPVQTRKTLKIKQGDDDGASVLDSVEDSQEKSKKSKRKDFDDGKSMKSTVSRRGGLAARDQKEFLRFQKSVNEQLLSIQEKFQEFQGNYNTNQEKFEQLLLDIQAQKEMDAKYRLEKIQRALIATVVGEMFTPIKRNFNVDLKRLRKHLEDCINNVEEHQDKIIGFQRQFDQMNTTLIKQMRNMDIEKQQLDRELKRMQQIDRIKVQHARDSFFNPDTGKMLPSFQTMLATNINSPMSLGSHDIQSQLLNGSVYKEVVTSNELRGECERMRYKPSQRQRIIIARSQEQKFRNKSISNRMAYVNEEQNQNVKNVIGLLNQTTNSFISDSIISGGMKTTKASRPSVTQGNIGVERLGGSLSSPVQIEDQIVNNQFGYLDVQNPQIPNAMSRIKMKLNQRHMQVVDKKIQQAKLIEASRKSTKEKYQLLKF